MDARKRARPAVNGNAGFKKAKQESDSTGVGSKTKPCTKFFSPAGCPFGESCHFLHYVPGGYNAVSQMMNLGPVSSPVSRNVAPPPVVRNGAPTPGTKTKMCSKYNTAEGCRFGDKCHFAHGQWELGKPAPLSYEEPRGIGSMLGRFAGRYEAPAPDLGAFGASATCKISVDASMAGAIIGKGGVNSKQISRQTGAKLSIRDHESDSSLRNIELEGTFEQIKEASAMVRELIVRLGPVTKGQGAPGSQQRSASNFKTKLCDNFSKGSCTFGDKCHFAHGAAELRTSAA